MVNVIKFWTLIASDKCLDNQCRPRSDCFFRSSLIKVFPLCYSDKHFVNSSPNNQQFEIRKRKVFKIYEQDKFHAQLNWAWKSFLSSSLVFSLLYLPFFYFYTPANFVCGGYTVFKLSHHASVRNVFFFNILKSHGWIFIKPCKHVHICKTNTLDKKVRARGQFY